MSWHLVTSVDTQNSEWTLIRWDRVPTISHDIARSVMSLCVSVTDVCAILHNSYAISHDIARSVMSLCVSVTAVSAILRDSYAILHDITRSVMSLCQCD